MHRTWKNGLPIMHVPATENYQPVQNRGGKSYWKQSMEVKLVDYPAQKVSCAPVQL